MQRYLDQFQRFIANGAASAPEWVTSARKASILRFEAQGWPTTKDEDWHFTSPSPIVDREFTFEPKASGSVSAAELKQFAFGQGCHTVMFVNGRHSPAHSTRAELKGVHIHSLADAWTTAPELAKKVGADAYASHAAMAVEVAKELVASKVT